MAVYTTIDDAGSYFNPKLWVGSTSPNVITGVGFQPDLLWIKDRDSTAYHVLSDAVRGTDSQIYSNSTSAEGVLTTVVTSFDSGGFTISGDYPNDGNDYVTWCWKAGTTTGIAGSPSITPSGYSFNATSGFSIIAYVGIDTAGATIPHGLGVAPNMVIIKDVDNSNDWAVYHSALGGTKYLLLNTTGAVGTATSVWNDTDTTSTLVTLGTTSKVNYDPRNYIAYCFANIQGYSKFGSYLGNGSADGAFVYTGFRPAFVIIKTVGADGWIMADSKRVGYNPENDFLAPNNSGADQDVTNLDLYSNGFKLMTTNSAWNPDGVENIYMAFAEAPLVNSEGVPVNAR